MRFLAQFTDLFAVVLLIASGVTLLAYLLQHPRDFGNVQLAIAILCVVVLNAVIGFLQEYSAERTAQALQAMVPNTCRVLRDGLRQEITGAALVPGDLVLLEAGDAVPADCRLVEAHSFAVNNAALSGESAPVGRRAEPTGPDVPVLDARNLVFMGTTVAAGSGKAVVVTTGAATQFGRIFGLTMEAPTQKSPLQRQVAAMARRISAAAVGIGALVFLLRLPAGQPVVSSFVFALGVMVALVPEGLPATLSVSLAIGVRRMAGYHAVVKRLLAVEALGSTTVICTDKTCQPRHRHQEFLRFLKQVARAYPEQELHLVMDNYAAHKRVEIRRWLAANPRVQVHFTPTSASWMNLVEVWFGIIERQAIHRGTFGSVKELNTKIRAFIDGWNDRGHPFIWTKTADQILAKANRQKTSNSGH